MKKMFIFLAAIVMLSCSKNDEEPLRYFEVGTDANSRDWRDTSFIVATSDATLCSQIEAQLLLPANQRKLVHGALSKGSGGYNKNAGHEFKWHFREDDWQLVDVTAEIFDGRPYSDVDLHTDYWLDTVKRFGSWSSYVKREILK
jgi:hypothetical protein